MKSSKKKIPRFKSEDAERKFWASRDSTEYLDWTQGTRRADFQRLHPTLKTISLRLPAGLIAELKVLANKRDVPYQSLLKLFLAERVKEELKPAVHRVV
ncbi:MAG: BrnA antitoxin family protein [Deltaproteobacteria bacterium]|nr:BrnA antitoxin family protein [Deltaproteobacteria bacterium]